jgi:hypothetical protein
MNPELPTVFLIREMISIVFLDEERKCVYPPDKGETGDWSEEACWESRFWTSANLVKTAPASWSTPINVFQQVM